MKRGYVTESHVLESKPCGLANQKEVCYSTVAFLWYEFRFVGSQQASLMFAVSTSALRLDVVVAVSYFSGVTTPQSLLH